MAVVPPSRAFFPLSLPLRAIVAPMRPALSLSGAARALLLACLALCLVVSAGCDKRSGGTSAPLEYMTDAAESEAYYDFENDSIDGEVLSVEGANLSSRGRSRHGGMVDVRGSFDASPEPPKPSPSAPSTAPLTAEVDTSVDPPSQDPVPTAAKRQVIYTATMQISVYEVAAAVDTAEALPDRLGGWVQQRDDTMLVLRIPAAELDAAMELLAGLGVVDRRTLEALDVTAQYTDLDGRIRVLSEMQIQLGKLLTKAKTVAEALEIRKALDAVTLELERARTHMRSLAESIAFSTLVVRFVARGPAHELPSSNDPFPWTVSLGVEVTEYR